MTLTPEDTQAAGLVGRKQIAWAPTEPGVVEAAILADEVATRSW